MALFKGGKRAADAIRRVAKRLTAPSPAPEHVHENRKERRKALQRAETAREAFPLTGPGEFPQTRCRRCGKPCRAFRAWVEPVLDREGAIVKFARREAESLPMFARDRFCSGECRNKFFLRRYLKRHGYPKDAIEEAK